MRTGSHICPKFNGKHEDEYRWFSLSASLPGVSMSAERAAGLIVKAAKLRQAESVFPWNAVLATKVHGLFPALTANLASLAHEKPAQRHAPNTAKEGRNISTAFESELEKTAKALGVKATQEYNQVAGANQS